MKEKNIGEMDVSLQKEIILAYKFVSDKLAELQKDQQFLHRKIMSALDKAKMAQIKKRISKHR